MELSFGQCRISTEIGVLDWWPGRLWRLKQLSPAPAMLYAVPGPSSRLLCSQMGASRTHKVSAGLRYRQTWKKKGLRPIFWDPQVEASV